MAAPRRGGGATTRTARPSPSPSAAAAGPSAPSPDAGAGAEPQAAPGSNNSRRPPRQPPKAAGAPFDEPIPDVQLREGIGEYEPPPLPDWPQFTDEFLPWLNKI